jgi:ribosomal protein S18 acetylase RimI-like enzyme
MGLGRPRPHRRVERQLSGPMRRVRNPIPFRSVVREDRGVQRVGDASTDMREIVAKTGVDRLALTNLGTDDLPRIGWSGSPLHLRRVAHELSRVKTGDAEYLAVRAPDGSPLATGGIDYVQEPGVGTIWQLATRPDVRRLGIGTRLIDAAEARIRARGCRTAKLSVEHDNPRARALYERLGYLAVGDRGGAWDAQHDDGSIFTHETVLTDMEKHL